MILSTNSNTMRFKFLNDVKKLNVLFIETQKLVDLELTIFDIFLNSLDENSQLLTKKKEIDNSFDIIIESQLLQ